MIDHSAFAKERGGFKGPRSRSLDGYPLTCVEAGSLVLEKAREVTDGATAPFLIRCDAEEGVPVTITADLHYNAGNLELPSEILIVGLYGI